MDIEVKKVAMMTMAVQRLFKIGVFSVLLSAPVLAKPLSSDQVTAPNSAAKVEWQLVSTATATWMWLDIYQASLYTAAKTLPFLPRDFLSDKEPLKLTLCYLKPISSDIFIEGASEVLPKALAPSLQAEVNRLHQAYQPVEPGDCYALEYTIEQGTALKLNDKLIFNSKMPGFKAIYFGIWLGDNPLSEALKMGLLTIKVATK